MHFNPHLPPLFLLIEAKILLASTKAEIENTAMHCSLPSAGAHSTVSGCKMYLVPQSLTCRALNGFALDTFLACLVCGVQVQMEHCQLLPGNSW